MAIASRPSLRSPTSTAWVYIAVANPPVTAADKKCVTIAVPVLALCIVQRCAGIPSHTVVGPSSTMSAPRLRSSAMVSATKPSRSVALVRGDTNPSTCTFVPSAIENVFSGGSVARRQPSGG